MGEGDTKSADAAAALKAAEEKAVAAKEAAEVAQKAAAEAARKANTAPEDEKVAAEERANEAKTASEKAAAASQQADNELEAAKKAAEDDSVNPAPQSDPTPGEIKSIRAGAVGAIGAVIAVFALVGVKEEGLGRLLRDEASVAIVVFGAAIVVGCLAILLADLFPEGSTARKWILGVLAVFEIAVAVAAVVVAVSALDDRGYPTITATPLSADKKQVTVEAKAAGSFLRSKDLVLLRVTAVPSGYSPKDAGRKCLSAGSHRAQQGEDDQTDSDDYQTTSTSTTASTTTPVAGPGAAPQRRASQQGISRPKKKPPPIVELFWGQGVPGDDGTASRTARVTVNPRTYKYLCIWAAYTKREEAQDEDTDSGVLMNLRSVAVPEDEMSPAATPSADAGQAEDGTSDAGASGASTDTDGEPTTGTSGDSTTP